MLSTQIEKVASNSESMIITAKVFSADVLPSYGEFILKGRNNHIEYTSTIFKLQKIVEGSSNKNIYSIKGVLEYKRLNNRELLSEDVYDLYLSLNDCEEIKVRMGKPTFKGRFLKKAGCYSNHSDVMLINPYYTFKKSNLSIEIVKYPLSIYNYYKWAIRLSLLIRIWLYPKDIWLVGEQPYKAQDTGLAFFKYVRRKYPNKEIYYVMDTNSPEYEKIKKMGNIIPYKSKQHILYAIGARRIISSHHPEYLYPSKTEIFKRRVKGTKVFLQHGIMGTKNMTSNYGKKAYNFSVDEFLVSSDFEKRIIIKDFGYDSRQVHVTGLSRFDTLLNQDTTVKRQVLIIPTWRDWITTATKFTDSEYFQKYKVLMESEKLHHMAASYNFSIVFCLHPNMQLYSDLFMDTPHVKVINQGEVNVQDLLKESALMVTDYSSVGFDFSFLNKPVIYYQFDRARFLGDKGSHLNLDQDLPGKICVTNQGVLKLIEDYAKIDFAVEDEYIKRSNKFIKYGDNYANKRIYQVVKNAKKSDRVKNTLVFMVFKKSMQKIIEKIRR